MTEMTEQEIEQKVSSITKFILAFVFVFLNGLVIWISWNSALVAIFPSVIKVSYIQACTLGILGKALFAPTRSF